MVPGCTDRRWLAVLVGWAPFRMCRPGVVLLFVYIVGVRHECQRFFDEFLLLCEYHKFREAA